MKRSGEIAVHLSTNDLVGYLEHGFVCSLAGNGEHAEVVEQRDEVVGVGDGLRGEVVFQVGSDGACLYDVLLYN